MLGRQREGSVVCPTCGRLEVDLFAIMAQLEEKLEGVKKPVKIAVRGCVVYGPGEASEADIGIAAGKGVAILYRKGEVIKRVREDEIVPTILKGSMVALRAGSIAAIGISREAAAQARLCTRERMRLFMSGVRGGSEARRSRCPATCSTQGSGARTGGC